MKFNMQDSHYMVVPLLLYMLGGMLCLFFNKRILIQRIVFLLVGVLACAAAVKLVAVIDRVETLSLQVGAWEQPFGITVSVDRFAALMVFITALLALAVSIYSFSDRVLSIKKKRIGFYPSLLFMLAGITGAFITSDLFNLYVWFEVMLVSSFVLITLGSKKDQLQGGIKYVVINFVASSFLLLAIGVLYGTTGHVNFTALAESLRLPEVSSITQLASVLLLVSFGIKAALFPFYFWLPSSYHTPPIAVIAIVSGLLTKVGVYTLIRTYTLLFPLHQNYYTQHILLILACVTMLVGVLGAIAQRDIRKVLAYNLISKIGFMVLGLAIYTPAALAGTIFYMLHHILVKTNLFFTVGVIAKITGTYNYKKMGGLYDRYPVLSFVFLLLAFVLVGIPPFSGFWGKFMLAEAGIQAGQYVPVGLLLFTSLLTLYSMMLVWKRAFLVKPIEEHQQIAKENVVMKTYIGMYLAGALLLTFTLWISFSPGWLIAYTQKAAMQLIGN